MVVLSGILAIHFTMSMSFDPNTTPLAMNPNGDPPNFVNPETQAPTVLATGLLLIIISTICVVARCHSSWKGTGKLNLDDCKNVSDCYLA